MSASVRSRALLLTLVFISGMASLGVEFGASRLLAPYFGTSLYVWGVLIGLILIYLSAGYVIGGRLADRYPREEVLYQITAWAGLWIGIIPLVSYPILLISPQGFREVSVGLVAGTLLAVVVLFAAPVILLGCVSPFAIRLLLRNVETGGNTAGRVYALSTAGSILGTFLPVFWFIPSYGTRPTLEGFGLVLVAVSVLGLWPWPRRRFYAAFAAAVILAWIFLPSGIKPPQVGQLVYEKESAYGYIQVVREGTKTELILNEGEAIHSIYDTSSLLTGGPWDYMVIANAFRPAQHAELVPIDVAHRYFHLDEPNVHGVVADARYWIDTTSSRFDVIVMDAYRQPYIPFHLTTREFFSEVRDHLRPGGVAVVNAGRTATDYRLVDAIASTMAAVYTNVFLVDVPAFNNTLVYGTTEPVTTEDVLHNLALVHEPVAETVARSVINEGRLRVSPYHGQVFTDDLAPVERLIDEIIFSYLTGR